MVGPQIARRNRGDLLSPAADKRCDKNAFLEEFLDGRAPRYGYGALLFALCRHFFRVIGIKRECPLGVCDRMLKRLRNLAGTYLPG